MTLSFILLLIGFILIVIAANALTDGAAFIAFQHGISPMLIGLTLVAIGTSLPEIMVSIIAAIQHKTALALGNVIGSNIANIGLVLGVTLLIRPLTLTSNSMKNEFVLLFICMLITTGLMLDGFLSTLDGLVLSLSLCLLLIFLMFKAKKDKNVSFEKTSSDHQKKVRLPWLRIFFGIVLLPISAQLIVFSSSHIAHSLGVSDIIIGLTIVALGTSLPEVATSLSSAFKGHDDIAIGNIIGSNMFNLVAVLPFVALIHPDKIPTNVLIRDIPVMFVLTLILLALVCLKIKKLPRITGVIFLLLYFSYLTLLAIQQ